MEKLLIQEYFVKLSPKLFLSRRLFSSTRKVNTEWWLEWQIFFFPFSSMPKDFPSFCNFSSSLRVNPAEFSHRKEKLLTFIIAAQRQNPPSQFSSAFFYLYFHRESACVWLCVRWIILTSKRNKSQWQKSAREWWNFFPVEPFPTSWILRSGKLDT